MPDGNGAGGGFFFVLFWVAIKRVVKERFAEQRNHESGGKWGVGVKGSTTDE